MTDALARRLAHWAVSLRSDDLPPEVVDKAKTVLLHGIGIGLAGHPEPISRAALEFVRAGETAGEAGCAILGTDLRATAAGAAFANSVLLHARLQEDAYRTASHPGSTVIPAALAVAEQTGATGRDLLLAIVAGYEVMAAVMADTVPLTTPRGFRATPLYGGFGAAAAAAKLLGLDEDRFTSALNFAATLTGGTTGGMGSGMAMMAVQNAWAARNGLLAAQVAAAGAAVTEDGLEVKGGFYPAFAGLTDPPDSAAHLGREWRIHEVTLKRYPSAMFNQPIIHVALGLVRTHDLPADRIDRIRLELADFEIRYPSNEFKERLESLSAPALMVAQAIADKRGPTSPHPKTDPPSAAARALLPKIEVAGGRSGLSPRLTVTLRDGSSYTAETHDAADFRFDFAEDAAIVRSLRSAMPIDSRRLDQVIEDIARVDTLPSTAPLVPVVGARR